MATKTELEKRIKTLEDENSKLSHQLNHGNIVNLRENSVTIHLDNKIMRVSLDENNESFNINTLDHIPFIRPYSSNKILVNLEIK